MPASVIVAVVAVSACGGEQPQDDVAVPDAPEVQAAPDAPADACAVLTGDDVAAVIGEAVTDSVALSIAAGEGSLSQCNYATAVNPAAASLMLQSAPGQTAVQGIGGVRQTMEESGVAVEEVSGLGDAALWAGGQLHAFTEGWHLVVSPVGGTDLEQARTLMERALARLP